MVKWLTWRGALVVALTWSAGVYASLLGALVALVGVGAFGYEAWALATGATPITGYVRAGIARWPGWAFVAILGIGLLLGHFFWQ